MRTRSSSDSKCMNDGVHGSDGARQVHTDSCCSLLDRQAIAAALMSSLLCVDFTDSESPGELIVDFSSDLIVRDGNGHTSTSSENSNCMAARCLQYEMRGKYSQLQV